MRRLGVKKCACCNLCNKYNKNVFNVFSLIVKKSNNYVFYSLDKIRIRNICIVSQNC